MFDDRWQYLALLIGALVVTVPLEFVYGFKVWRAPARLLRCLLPSGALMVAWDLWAIHRGHWHFSASYTSGLKLPGGLPIEEFLFFLLIPAAGISGYEATRTQLRRWNKRR